MDQAPHEIVSRSTSVAQVPGIGPIDESDLTDQLRFYPTALLHLLRGPATLPTETYLLKLGV
jgi:hypothetical protein